MIELLSLQFGNLRSFVDDQRIVFEGREKLIQIDGKNENTGGSSGAGKTSILMALDYLLDIGDTPTTVLQSRLTKDGIWAIGEFRFDGVLVIIHRSKKDGLVIELPNETISGNAKLATEKLEELIGLPKKIFKKMVHKKQKEGGFFLNMTPKETYEFLVSVLGLEKFISDIDVIQASTVTEKAKISALEQQIQLNQASILDMNRILSEKKKPEPTVHEDEIKQLNHGVLALRSNIGGLKLEMKMMVDEIPKPEELTTDTSEINHQIAELVGARVEFNNKLATVEKAKAEVETSLVAIPHAIEAAKRAGSEIAKIRSEKEHMEKSQCPTCMQVWVGDTLQEKIAKAEANIQYFMQEALDKKKIIDEKPSLLEKRDRLNQIIGGIKDALADLQEKRSQLDATKYQKMEETSRQNEAARNQYKAQVTSVEGKIKSTIDTVNEELKRVEIELSTKEAQRNSYLTAASQYEKDIASITNVIVTKQTQLQAASNELQLLKHKIMVADESCRLIKAYVLQTFQETLDAIGEATTNILAGIPNMATSTVYFEGCKETKSGSIKDEIVAIVNTDGNNDVPIKSLSGGERTAIDLAVDLAVIDVIETKVSKGANFFFMDEPFDGLDSVCKENCLEILKQVDTNKKIIMVDHSSELKEMVSDVILVVKSGETSTIAS